MAGLVIKVLLRFCYYLLIGPSWDNSPSLNSQSRFYVLLTVSIVSSCIDVACHVNMHFGVSAEKIKRHCFIISVSVCLFSDLEVRLKQHKSPPDGSMKFNQPK